MTQSTKQELLNGKAYGLFFQEYRTRLDSLETAISAGISSADQADWKLKFHTLKGGAGFFGFERVYQIAATLESLCAQSSTFGASEVAQVASFLEELREIQSLMPDPKVSI